MRDAIIGARRSQVTRGRPAWRSSYPLPPFVTRKGAITVDPSLQAMTLGFIEAIAPALAEAYATELGPVAEAAFDAWPVKTGLSRSLLTLEYTIPAPTLFSASLVCRADYAGMIKVGPSLVVDQLIFEPVTAAADRIAARAASDIAAA